MESFETILARMTDAYRKEAGVEPADATDIGIRLKVVAGEVHAMQAYLDYIERQAFVQTAVGEGLDRHAEQHGLARRAQSFAQGELTFGRSEALDYAVDIPAGVVCTATGENPPEFVTTQPCVLQAQSTEVTVPARAVAAGQGGNAVAGAVTVLSTVPVGVETVVNREAFSGGRDAEADDSLRARLLAACKMPIAGANAEYYRRAALECPGIASACAVPREFGDGTVGVYVRAEDGAVTDEQLQAVQERLDALREISVAVTVQKAKEASKSVQVYVEPAQGCTTEAAKAESEKAIRAYFATLQIGDPFMLVQVGRYLMESGFVSNYEFALSATDGTAVVGSVYVPGTIWVGDM